MTLYPKKVIFIYKLIPILQRLVVNVDDYRLLYSHSELIFFQTEYDFIPFLEIMDLQFKNKYKISQNEINCLHGEPGDNISKFPIFKTSSWGEIARNIFRKFLWLIYVHRTFLDIE